MNLISPAGYGGTGSSAVTNFLQEFESILCFGNSEFQFTSYTDGIADLENILIEGHSMKVDLAIKRFLQFCHILSNFDHYKKYFNNKFEEMAIQYINDIISINWTGWWPHEVEETIYFSKKIKEQFLKEKYKLFLKDNIKQNVYEPDGWQTTYFPQSKVYYEHLYNEEKINDFIKKTQKFTDNLLQEAVNSNNKYKYVLLDQSIPCINISQYIRYFSSPQVIIVDRDPRDLYILNKAYWGQGWIPSYDVQIFIKYYLSTRQTRRIELQNTKNNSLFIPFESLIYEYDNSIKKIIDFIGLTNYEHTNKLKYFNPELSIRNTQLYINYPELQNEIELIEKNLSEYCYNYPYTKEKKEENHFFFEEIDRKFNEMNNKQFIGGGKVFISLIKMTKYYRTIHDPNFKINFIVLIKLIIKLLICPFEILIYFFTLLFL